MTLSQAFYSLRAALVNLYDESEAAAIAHEYLFSLTGKDKLQRLMDKEMQLSDAQKADYDAALPRLLAGEPLQYITGLAHFLGRDFNVNKYVLIPRPETEELVQWIIDDFGRNIAGDLNILDIGTGSGCIPVSLKLAIPKTMLTTCDISSDAIALAQSNAQKFGADISLLQLDFLVEERRNSLPQYDIIVSNPPYIPIAEKKGLSSNVRDYEPSTALFVPNEDPLLFYRHIAIFAQTHLKEGGAVYCELHRDYAGDTGEMFQSFGYHTILREDMHGALRMLKAIH